jgi:hypothetical protein
MNEGLTFFQHDDRGSLSPECRHLDSSNNYALDGIRFGVQEGEGRRTVRCGAACEIWARDTWAL